MRLWLLTALACAVEVGWYMGRGWDGAAEGALAGLGVSFALLLPASFVIERSGVDDDEPVCLYWMLVPWALLAVALVGWAADRNLA